MYGNTKQAKKHYAVSADTLRRWSNAGKIKFQRTKGGHRRYFIPKDKNPDKKRIIYARVSSSKQKSDLRNQINFLSEKYPDYQIVSDIGSGINFERKGFKSILEQLFDGNIEEVVVASKDRFSRFGFELFRSIFDRFDAQIIAVNETEDNTPEQELAEDLMSIITVFTAKYNGKRRYTIKEESEESEIDETEEETKKDIKEETKKKGRKNTKVVKKRKINRSNK